MKAFFAALLISFGLYLNGASVNNAYYAHNGKVTVLDLDTNLIIATITVGGLPDALAVSPFGNKVYVPNQTPGNVSIIDTTKNLVTATITTGGMPTAVRITSDGLRAFITNLDPNISVIDTTSDVIIATIATGVGTTAVAFTNDNTKAYAITESPSYLVIDTSTYLINQVTPLSILFPGSICVSLNGTKAYIPVEASILNYATLVLDTSSDTIIATITAGDGPEPCAMNLRLPLLYVTNAEKNAVSVIDTLSDVIIATIIVGSEPSAVAFSTDGTRAYTASNSTLDISVIDVSTSKTIATVTVNGSVSSILNLATCPDYVTPLAITISCEVNSFLAQKEFYNVLTWSTPIGGFRNTTLFKIYRNAELTDLIATIPALPLIKFEDHNLKKGETYTYFVVGEGDSMPASSGIISTTCK